MQHNGLSGSTGSLLPEARAPDASGHTFLGSRAGLRPQPLLKGGVQGSLQSTMSGKSGLLGGMEEVEDEEKPPEQPIVERDPSGRWSRVRALHAGLQVQLLLFSVYGKGELVRHAGGSDSWAGSLQDRVQGL